MSARAMWKGVVHLDEARVPVKLYAAAVDRRVHFRLLHEADHEPVRQRLVHSVTGEPVPHEEARKAYEVERGLLVVLDDEDLAALEPEPSRAIEVLGFLPPDAIPHPHFARPYHVGPDGDPGPYLALAEALRDRERAAVVRWVMRKKRYAGAVLPRERRLVLQALRRADQVVLPEQLETPSGRSFEAAERRLAEQLVEALAGPFEPEAFREDYQRRVRELIEAKAEGRAVKVERPRRKRPARSLERALKESLQAARERRVA